MEHPLEYSHSAIEFFYNTSFNDYAAIPVFWNIKLGGSLITHTTIDVTAELEDFIVAEMREVIDREILLNVFNITPHLNRV